MKGRFYIESPTEFFKGDEIDVPTDKPLKEIELTEQKTGEKLKARVAYHTVRGKNLNCLVDLEEKRNEIGFWFLKIPEPGQVFRRRGQNFRTGKFIPWVCHFERTGD